jgi:hypothetical protein
MKVIVGMIACLLLGAPGCASTQSAAARDPMKCERDPSCARGRASYIDCTRQCVDDPQCMDLCSQVQSQSDSLGH